VIRPINKAPDDASTGTTASTSATPGGAPVSTATPREKTAVPAAAKTPVTNTAPPPRLPAPNAAVAVRPDPGTRAAAPPAPGDATPDASSSNFIFYSGSGIAAFILLLSAAAFVRSRNVDSGPPRS